MRKARNAKEFRNQYTKKLQAYASSIGEKLVRDCCIPGAKFVLGGALAYDAALKGSYDLDLRLLVPDESDKMALKKRIDSVRDLLVEQAKGDSSFATRLIDENGTNYIQHTKRIVKIAGLKDNPDVEVSWNIQSEKSYQSISAMAAKMPRGVIDRYVILKGLAKEQGPDDYRTIKKEWKRFILWAMENGLMDKNGVQIRAYLKERVQSFPQFLDGLRNDHK